MLGAGGHARVLQEVLTGQGVNLSGFIAPSASGSQLVDVPWLGPDAALRELDPLQFLLVNGIGSSSSSSVRMSVYVSASELGYSFRSVIDPTAVVRESAQLGDGVQILAGAIVGSDVVVGDNTILNSGAIVEHGTVLGDHSHVSPRAALAGEVRVGSSTHIGLGALVIQGLTIGSNCTVGAGAVVIRDVPNGSLAVGVPATNRPIE